VGDKFMIRSAIYSLIGVLFTISVSANECSSLISELQAMRKANSTIHSSLITNHEMFATTLESYSDALSETAGRAHKTVSENMISSAQSFRDRGIKAQKMSKKLEQASDDLSQRISKCLK